MHNTLLAPKQGTDLEDEAHAVAQCPLYATQRKDFVTESTRDLMAY